MPRSRKPSTLVAGPELRRRWRVALADAETHEAAWAESRGVSKNHVREVVLGLRKSEHLLAQVIAYVRDRERRIAARIAADAAA
jgi:hypothetical protein